MQLRVHFRMLSWKSFLQDPSSWKNIIHPLHLTHETMIYGPIYNIYFFYIRSTVCVNPTEMYFARVCQSSVICHWRSAALKRRLISDEDYVVTGEITRYWMGNRSVCITDIFVEEPFYKNKRFFSHNLIDKAELFADKLLTRNQYTLSRGYERKRKDNLFTVNLYFFVTS